MIRKFWIGLANQKKVTRWSNKHRKPVGTHQTCLSTDSWKDYWVQKKEMRKMGVTEHMEYQWRKNKVQRESLKHKVWQKKANTEITQVQKQGGEEFSQTRQTRNNINRCAEEDKKKAQRGDLIKVYRITKELCGKANQVPPVKSSSGKINTTEKNPVSMMGRKL